MYSATLIKLNQRKFFLSILFICIVFLPLSNVFSQTQDDPNIGVVNGVWWINNDALGDVSGYQFLSPDEIATLNVSAASIKASYPATKGVLASLLGRV